MNTKTLPLLAIVLLASIKLPVVFNTRGSLDFIGWSIYTLFALHITWGYWKDKNFLSPPNFDYKDGTNEIARLIFVVGAITSYSIGCYWA